MATAPELTTFVVKLNFSHRAPGYEEVTIRDFDPETARDRVTESMHRWAEGQGFDDFDIGTIEVVSA